MGNYENFIEQLLDVVKEAQENKYSDYILHRDLEELVDNYTEELLDTSGIDHVNDLQDKINEQEDQINELEWKLDRAEEKIDELEDKIVELGGEI